MAVDGFNQPGILERFFGHQFYLTVQQVFQRMQQPDVVAIVRFIIKGFREAYKKVNIAVVGKFARSGAAKNKSLFHPILLHELLYLG